MTPAGLKSYAAIDEAVIDDLIAYTHGLPPAEKVGACELLTYILVQRTRLRRDAARPTKKGT
jgi:hypothetical protein